MAGQMHVVLDNPPLEDDAWARQVFAALDLPVVDNDAISTAMSKDEESRRILLEYAADPMAAADQLAPYYRRMPDKLYGDKPALGLYGIAWTAYVPVQACVVDWDEVERRASAPGIPAPDGEYFRQQSKAYVHARLEKYMAGGRVLELEPGLDLQQRVDRALAFLRESGVA